MSEEITSIHHGPGRPTLYTEELTNQICMLIAEGYSLRHIEAHPGMPHKSTIMDWCIKYPEFAEQYARAKEQQAEAFNEELVDIADDGRNDWIERETAGKKKFIALNEEAVARSKLRIETRKWLMGKMKPKKYADKQIHTGPDGEAPATFTLMIDRREQDV